MKWNLSLALIGSWRWSQSSCKAPTHRLIMSFVWFASLLPHSEHDFSMCVSIQFLLPLCPALGAAGEALVYSRRPELSQTIPEHFIIGRQKQTIHTLPHTYSQYGVSSWPHMLYMRMEHLGIKLRKKTSSGQESNNLSHCESILLNWAATYSFKIKVEHLRLWRSRE